MNERKRERPWGGSKMDFSGRGVGCGWSGRKEFVAAVGASVNRERTFGEVRISSSSTIKPKRSRPGGGPLGLGTLQPP